MKFLENNSLVLKLNEIIKKDRIFHCYLFYGEDFVLKREIARFFARTILCEKKTGFCRSCSSCKKFFSGNHLDFIEVGGVGQKGQSFSIYDVRKILEDAYINPNEGEYKVFLLNDVDSLLKSPLNALLKILESPPKGVVFILTACKKSGVLKTVASRCVDFYVGVCSKEEVLGYIKEKKFKIKDKGVLEEIIELSEGRLDLLEKYLTLKEAEKLVFISDELLNFILKGEEFKFLYSLQQLEKNLEDIFFVFTLMLLRLQVYLKDLKSFGFDEIEKIGKITHYFQHTIYNLKNNANVSLAISNLCCKIFGY